MGEGFFEDEFGAFLFEVVIDLRKSAADEVDAEASGLHHFERAALHFVRLALRAEIAEAEADAVVK